MTSENKSIQMDFSQFEKAISILKKEQRNNLFSRRQDIIIKGQNIGLLVFLIISLVNTYLKEFLELESIIFKLLQIVLLLSFIMFIICLFLGLPFHIRIYRFNRQIKRLGLSDVLDKPWKSGENKTRISNTLDGIAYLLGWGYILLILIIPFIFYFVTFDEIGLVQYLLLF
ncbi:hypothetical protein [Kriegella aquimaris]|uniref:Uncharacterized protein n=1 Tax=Kriegella aquimaris TaxID=192904 RepID=A0A1G9REH9_9FLAO|nr:hypothetical protein [Kriegella aquimaris]SDM21646.1 hypothetical protein SAMN04488514_106106 [Kriegella aquimaris]